jgi:hypothetical protein
MRHRRAPPGVRLQQHVAQVIERSVQVEQSSSVFSDAAGSDPNSASMCFCTIGFVRLKLMRW